MTKSKNSFKANAVRFVRKNWIGYAMQLPFAILFTIFVLAPAAIAIGLSFPLSIISNTTAVSNIIRVCPDGNEKSERRSTSMSTPVMS